MKSTLRHSIFLFLFVLSIASIQRGSAQTSFKNEAELKTKAASLFATGNYVGAFPLYSQLLSLDPLNPELNYKFAVCLLYSDRSNTEDPIKYLEKLINKIPDVDFFYHLAQAYHSAYFFTDAINNYRKYIQLAGSRANKDYQAERKIVMCQNGIELLRSATELYVLQKSEVDKKAFYRSYNLNDYSGRILNLPDEFLTKSDQQNNDDKLAYFNPTLNLLFYALDNKNQKDIYYRVREKSGEWLPPIRLNSTINSSYDEDFPVLMPDGKTLYFSSNGHNTMGGYDIFKTVFDSLSQGWSNPVNLGFPFNTPADDVLFISNKEGTTAWFASDRSSQTNKITVYKIGILKKEENQESLADVYKTEKLSNTELGLIKNMASLNINITEKRFNEIPIDQKNKPSTLISNDANRITQNIRQTNLININNQLTNKEAQDKLNDSVRTIINQLDNKLELVKSYFLQTQGFATNKTNQVNKAYSDLALLLEKAQKTQDSESKKALIKESNVLLFNTLRTEYQRDKLAQIEKDLNTLITNYRDILAQANIIFGDIQKNVSIANEVEARKFIKQLDNLLKKALSVPNYAQIINFKQGELISPDFPNNLLTSASYANFYIENDAPNTQPILTKDPRFSQYIPMYKPIANVQITPQSTNQEQAVSKPSVLGGEVKSQNTSPLPTENQIRENIIALNKSADQEIAELKKQSYLLIEQAARKLDESNTALFEFEKLKEKYNNGTYTDKDAVLQKQTESQNLLYQSLAIKSLADRIDSMHQSQLKRKENITNQTFAIEQSLQTNQAEKALGLYRVLEKSNSSFSNNLESLIKNWIEKDVKNINSKKTSANQAFEQSQKLTDESLKLLVEAKEIRDVSITKSNAFKRRELIQEAEQKEKESVQKQDEADKYMAKGTLLYEEIKKAEAFAQMNEKLETDRLLANNEKPLINTEKQKTILNDRLSTRESETPQVEKSDEKVLAQSNSPKIQLKQIPVTNDLISYETKRFKAHLLAEALDLNKRETANLLGYSKQLSGESKKQNENKIAKLRLEADSLQKASSQAFMESATIYKQLSDKDKKQADKTEINFENYLKNIQDRIAQLLEDAKQIGKQASLENNEEKRNKLLQDADNKEQIAMYLVLEEYEIIAQRNKQNYRNNALILEKLLFENSDKKELMQPVFDQINAYVLAVENKRTQARKQDLAFNMIKVLLQDAFSIEANALDLQLEAIRMMRDKDTESMLAYQSSNKQSPTSQTASNQRINSANQHIDKSENSKNLVSQNEIPAKNTVNKEKTQISNEAKKESTAIMNNATFLSGNSGKIPLVKIGSEPESGIQFSVQIAATSELKSTESFLNVMELFAIKDKEIELYRYFSGKFLSLKAAIIRRNSLQQQGFNDAFIKSWKEGAMVSLNEAAGELDEQTLELLNAANIKLPAIYKDINFSATNISQLNGAYYSVQIGVYSRPRSSAQLFNIQPIYHIRLKNGYWVYFNGIYKTLHEAEINKSTIQSKGIKDAFVVAFNEGEKVSLSDARKVLNEGGSHPSEDDVVILSEASKKVDIQLQSLMEGLTSNTKIYKVQIGVFKHEVSWDWMKSSNQELDKHNIEQTVSNTNNYVYTIGNFKSYGEALKFKNESVIKYVKDAFIVSFDNGKKVN